MGATGGSGGSAFCGGVAAGAVASNSPRHGVTGRGALKRSGPTGGSANGIPVNTRTPLAERPRTMPVRVSTRGPSVTMAGVEGELPKGLRLHLDGESGGCRRDIGSILDDAGIHEMLVQMIDILRDPSLGRAGDAEIIDDSQMLNILA